MKLLVVTNLFHPDRGGGASVFSDMCYGLAERGHDVTVYAAYPYYPEWRNKSGASLWKTCDEEIEGVKVRRFGMYLPKNPSRFLPRVLFELSFTISLVRSLFYFRRFDAVMSYCPVLGAVVYAAARKVFYREPLWLNVQDIPADAAAASGISRNPLTNALGQFAQSFFFNRADVWSTIAPTMVERLQTLAKRNQPIHLAPNFLNGTMELAVRAQPSKLGRVASGPVKLLYAGNIGKKQGLREFCEKLAESSLDFSFRIHGNGGEAENMRKWVEQRRDLRFQFGDFLDEYGFAAALNDADFFVITEKPGVGASFIPSKLIPCIATGTPVLCVCDARGPLGLEVEAHGLGIAFEWSQFDELIKSLPERLSSPDTIVQFQRNALHRAKAYGREPTIAFMEQQLKTLIAGRP